MRSSLNIELSIYDAAWKAALPFLKKNSRLKGRFRQRTLQENDLKPADIWIQASSLGESNLTKKIVETYEPYRPVRILMTSATDQGLSVLETHDRWNLSDRVNVYSACFPFDSPAVMKKATETIKPRVMVLLETEIWPGLISVLKQRGVKILMLNGRLREKSLSRYRLYSSAWPLLKPDRILAVSEENAGRFRRLFGKGNIGVMPNIKFDQVSIDHDSNSENPLKTAFGSNSVITLGSTRREEESQIEHIITTIRKRRPDTVIALFPRHMHRIAHWQSVLNRMNADWTLRSETASEIRPGRIVLWDVIGELTYAYALSHAVFIGGSLAPLGGQNFLEALSRGVIPVMGPSWENFAWVGKAIIRRGLVRLATDETDAANKLIKYLETPVPRKTVKKAALKYFEHRRGGTVIACDTVNSHLLQKDTELRST